MKTGFAEGNARTSLEDLGDRCGMHHPAHPTQHQQAAKPTNRKRVGFYQEDMGHRIVPLP